MSCGVIATERRWCSCSPEEGKGSSGRVASGEAANPVAHVSATSSVHPHEALANRHTLTIDGNN
jgi:hypothetical protein